MGVEFEEYFKIFIKNLIIEIIDFDLRKNVSLSDRDRKEILRKVSAKLDSIIEEIMRELRKENILRPDMLKDETVSSKVREIITRVLERHF